MRAATPVLPGEDPAAFEARLEAGPTTSTPATTWSASSSAGPCRSPGSSSGRPRPGGRAAEARDRATTVPTRSPRWAAACSGTRAGRPDSIPSDITLGDPPKLSWSGQTDDPDDPARLVNRLEATALGCARVLDRWAELREVLEAGQRWQPPDRFQAIRLLGRQPLDAGEDERVLGVYLVCAAMAPGTIEFLDVATELDHAERKRFMERLDEREVMRGPPPDERRQGAAAGDRRRRGGAARGAAGDPPGAGDADDLLSAFDASDAGERLRRYQATCDRRWSGAGGAAEAASGHGAPAAGRPEARTSGARAADGPGTTDRGPVPPARSRPRRRAPRTIR